MLIHENKEDLIMSNVTISESIKYIGADDTTLDLFESQYIIPNGISYNSYVILDEKVAVMDTIDARKSEEWFNNLSNVLAGRNVDYILNLTTPLISKHFQTNIQMLSLYLVLKPKLCFLSSLLWIILMTNVL